MYLLQSTFFVLVSLMACLCWCDARPLFGLDVLSSLFGGLDASGSNTTSVLSALALAHLQHKLDALAQFGELLSYGTNATANLFLN